MAGEGGVLVVRVEGGVWHVEGCGVGVKLSAQEKVASDPGLHQCCYYWYYPERTGTSCDTGNRQHIDVNSSSQTVATY